MHVKCKHSLSEVIFWNKTTDVQYRSFGLRLNKNLFCYVLFYSRRGGDFLCLQTFKDFYLCFVVVVVVFAGLQIMQPDLKAIRVRLCGNMWILFKLRENSLSFVFSAYILNKEF